MTNSILNPIVSLDPFLYVSGKEISNDADALVNLGKMQNYLHAHHYPEIMFCQLKLGLIINCQLFLGRVIASTWSSPPLFPLFPLFPLYPYYS